MVKIEIFNILGQVVREWRMENLSPGTYNVNWDGRDQSGSTIASGIYLYRIQSSDFVQTKKMVLLK